MKRKKDRPGSHAQALTSLLAGAWRSAPAEPLCSEEELTVVAPLLLCSGAAPLGWWRVSRSTLRDAHSAQALRAAYRFQHLQSAIYEHRIKRVFELVRSVGVEPLLIKGWVSGRYYAEKALRPYSDIDLIVRPEHLTITERLLRSESALASWVDLQHRCIELAACDLDSLFARSELVSLDGVNVRVPCQEDHLRLVAIHLLQHGAWRPLWLCDVAAAVEARTADFDWPRCLGANRQRAQWVACAILLAHRLLGAQIEETLLEQFALASWLPRSVLKHWEMPVAAAQSPARYGTPMAAYLSRPAGVLGAIGRRWPDPIIATINVGGAFNRLPRLPYQLGYGLQRGLKFARTLPVLLRESA